TGTASRRCSRPRSTARRRAPHRRRRPSMTEKSLRFARFTVLASFVLLVLSLGGSLYEHLVLDTVWIDNPSVIRGASGGATRTYFWIPMHGAITLALVAALAATWKHRPARNAVLLGFGL